MGRSSFIQLLAFSAVPFSTVDAVRFRYYGPNDVKRSEDASAKRHLDDPIIDPIIPDPVSSCEPVTVTVCDSSAISSAFASATSAFEASSSAVISSALASYTSELDFSSSLVAQSSSALPITWKVELKQLNPNFPSLDFDLHVRPHILILYL